MLIVDTDILIDVQRGNPAALAWFSGLIELPSVPGFVVMELFQGCQNGRDVMLTKKLVSHLPVIWPTELECNRALTDFSKLYLSHRLGLLDALIANCAIGRNATLCSFNEKHYLALPGLILSAPYVRATRS